MRKTSRVISRDWYLEEEIGEERRGRVVCPHPADFLLFQIFSGVKMDTFVYTPSPYTCLFRRRVLTTAVFSRGDVSQAS